MTPLFIILLLDFIIGFLGVSYGGPHSDDQPQLVGCSRSCEALYILQQKVVPSSEEDISISSEAGKVHVPVLLLQKEQSLFYHTSTIHALILSIYVSYQEEEDRFLSFLLYFII